MGTHHVMSDGEKSPCYMEPLIQKYKRPWTKKARWIEKVLSMEAPIKVTSMNLESKPSFDWPIIFNDFDSKPIKIETDII